VRDRDVAAVEVEHDQRFEDVADLGLLERQRRRGVPLDRLPRSKKTITCLLEDEPSDRWELMGGMFPE